MEDWQIEPSREDLLARLAQAQEAIRKLQRAHDAMFDACTTAQRRSTECLDLARANGRIAKATPGRLHALSHTSHERDRQDARWGAVANLLDIPDGCGSEWDYLLEKVRYEAARHCEATGRETCCMAHVALEECCETICETDPKLMRAEAVQAAASFVKWIEVIDLRAARHLMADARPLSVAPRPTPSKATSPPRHARRRS